MFGYWFNRRVYENVPPSLFFSGLVLVFASIFIVSPLTSSLMAAGGVSLIIGAISAIVSRNQNRRRSFKLAQLYTFSSD